MNFSLPTKRYIIYFLPSLPYLQKKHTQNPWPFSASGCCFKFFSRNSRRLFILNHEGWSMTRCFWCTFGVPGGNMKHALGKMWKQYFTFT